jgi:hypothetical protein
VKEDTRTNSKYLGKVIPRQKLLLRKAAVEKDVTRLTESHSNGKMSPMIRMRVRALCDGIFLNSDVPLGRKR